MWISLNDKVPLHGEKVLTYTSQGIVAVRKMGVHKFPAHADNVVTHWMPIPAPLKAL